MSKRSNQATPLQPILIRSQIFWHIKCLIPLLRPQGCSPGNYHPLFQLVSKLAKEKCLSCRVVSRQNLITLVTVGAAKCGQFNGESGGIGTSVDKSVGK